MSAVMPDLLFPFGKREELMLSGNFSELNADAALNDMWTIDGSWSVIDFDNYDDREYGEESLQILLENPTRDVETLEARLDLLDILCSDKGIRLGVSCLFDDICASVSEGKKFPLTPIALSYLVDGLVNFENTRKSVDSSVILDSILNYVSTITQGFDYAKYRERVWTTYNPGDILERYVMTDKLRDMSHLFQDEVREGQEVTKLLEPLLEPLAMYLQLANFYDALQEKGVGFCRPDFRGAEERVFHAKNLLPPQFLPSLFGNKKFKLVGNNFSSTPKQHIFVLYSGNSGGKSSALKTVGLNEVMAYSGLYPLATSYVTSSIDGIYCFIGTPEMIEAGEGQTQLRALRKVAEGCTGQSLALIDDPYGGTNMRDRETQLMHELGGFYSSVGTRVYLVTWSENVARRVDNREIPPAACFHPHSLVEDSEVVHTHKIRPGFNSESYFSHLAKQERMDVNSLSALAESKLRT